VGPHGRPRPPPPKGKKLSHHPSCIYPLNSALSPLQSPITSAFNPRSIEAPSTPAIEGTRPPPPLLRPIKGCPTLSEYPHTSNTPSLSPHYAHAAAFSAEAPLLVRHLLVAFQASVLAKLDSPWRPPSFPHLAASRRGPERPLGRAPVSSTAGHGGQSTMDRARRWSMSHGPSPCHFLLENNLKIEYSSHFFI
jgi:hypothetical protein